MTGYKISTPASRPIREGRQNSEIDSIVLHNVTNIYIICVSVNVLSDYGFMGYDRLYRICYLRKSHETLIFNVRKHT